MRNRATARPRMTRSLKAAWLVAGGLGLAPPALAQADCRLDSGGALPSQARNVLLLDTSASMVGQGDGRADIFRSVKASALNFLEASGAPARIVTFDQGLRAERAFAPGDRAALRAYLSALPADGRNTWLYRSLGAALGKLPRDPGAATTVYVVTDGRDNDPATRYTIGAALRAFEGSRGPFDKLYYVALGTTVPPEVQASFARTEYARALALPLGQAPRLGSGNLAPALLDIGPDRPASLAASAAPQLDTSRFQAAGADLSVATEGGQAVTRLQGTDQLPAGTLALLCSQQAGRTERTLLRYRPAAAVVQVTPPATDSAANPAASGASTVAPATAASGASVPAQTDQPQNQLQSAPGQSTPGQSGQLTLLNPEVDRGLRRGQSVTYRYRVTGGSLAVRGLDTPSGLQASLEGAAPGEVLQDGKEFGVRVTNQSLDDGRVGAPNLRLASGEDLTLPAVQARRGGGGGALWWLLLVPLAGLAWWLLGRRRGAAAPPAAWLERARGLSVDRGELILHGEGSEQARRPLQDGVNDLGARFGAPSLAGLLVERSGDGARLLALPAALRLIERGRPLAVGDPLRPGLLYNLMPAAGKAASAAEPVAAPVPVPVPLDEPAVVEAPTPAVGRDDVSSAPVVEPVPAEPVAVEPTPAPAVEPVAVEPVVVEPITVEPTVVEPVAEPAPTEPISVEPVVVEPAQAVVIAPVAQPAPLEVAEAPSLEPEAAPTDFSNLTGDIASLGILGGVGGLGVPRELDRRGEEVILRGEEGEQAEALPEGDSDLGEAFGVPAMRGLALRREGERLSLSGLPAGFGLRAGDQALRPGDELPQGLLTLSVPGALHAAISRLRSALGQQVDTRDAGVDLSGANAEIDLDLLFGGDVAPVHSAVNGANPPGLRLIRDGLTLAPLHPTQDGELDLGQHYGLPALAGLRLGLLGRQARLLNVPDGVNLSQLGHSLQVGDELASGGRFDLRAPGLSGETHLEW